MSDLLVVGYDDKHQADEVRLRLIKLQREYLVDLADAVVAVRNPDGKVELHQVHNLTAAGALGGGFWGALIGMLFMSPLLGFAVGAASGAVRGALSDVGINDAFMKELAGTLTPGHSALFVLVRKMAVDKILAELQGTGGRVLKTSLSNEDEARLQAAMDSALKVV